MIRPIIPKTQNKGLFCQEYWERVLNKTTPIKNSLCTEYMDVLNYRILGLRNGYSSNKAYTNALFNADFAIKTSTPAKWKHIFYRGISIDSNNADIKLLEYFNKCKNLNKGDYICFPQYAFITKFKELAQSHMQKKG